MQKDGAAYFGPFYPATAMRQTLRLVRQLFPLRTCRIKIDGTLPRPCLQYFIHRCKAPCTGWETAEGYARDGAGSGALPRGQGRRLSRMDLTREMEAAAGELKFERAAGLRDQIQALNTVRERQKMISTRRRTRTSSASSIKAPTPACSSSSSARVGCSVGSRSSSSGVAGATPGDVLSAFIRQFYAKDVTPPPEILLSEELPEAELTATWLAQRRAGRVELLVPQRGTQARPRRDGRGERRARARDPPPSRAAAGITSCWRSSSGRSPCPARPTGSRASTSRRIQGSETVASMVVWQDGDMKKDEYKRYKIRTVTGTDDFASMQEVLTPPLWSRPRGEGVLPDLVLLDGGRVSSAWGSRRSRTSASTISRSPSLAKRAEEVYPPDRLEPLVLDLGSPALQALQKIRDEAHRFAISYHKKLRQRRTIASVLDEIPGVGPTLRTSLLKTLGSAEASRPPRWRSWRRCPKVTPKLAQAHP